MHLVAESSELILLMSTNEEKLRFWNRGRWHFAVEWRGKLEASHAYKIRPIFNPIKPDFQIFVFVFVSFSIQSNPISRSLSLSLSLSLSHFQSNQTWFPGLCLCLCLIFNPVKLDWWDQIHFSLRKNTFQWNCVLILFDKSMGHLCKQPFWIFSSSSSSILEVEEPNFGQLGIGGSPQILLSWGQFHCKQMICAGALSPFLGQLYLWQCFNSLLSQNLHLVVFVHVSSQAADL